MVAWGEYSTGGRKGGVSASIPGFENGKTGIAVAPEYWGWFNTLMEGEGGDRRVPASQRVLYGIDLLYRKEVRHTMSQMPGS
jgi:hypothetical protein